MSNRQLDCFCLMVAIPALAVAVAGCSGTDGNGNGGACDEPTLQHSPKPFNFPEAHPPEDGEENRGDRERTPFEATFHLRSQCRGEDIEVEKSCLVEEGDEIGYGKTTEHFSIEGPEPSTISHGQDSVIRLTYTREEPNQGDDIDDAAMVIQSNAANWPTLVVPVCARVVPESEDRDPERVPCAAPIEQPEKGEKVDGLCEN